MAGTFIFLASLWGLFGSSVSADEGGIRLVNGSHRCSGRVEILHSGLWGTICDDNWDIRDAKVVCRQLSCGAAVSAPGSAHFGRGSGSIWLDDVQCRGFEPMLHQCPARMWGENDCSHREDAGVICSGVPVIRLMNGTNNCSGRVEVLHNGEWGTICDDEWDIRDAAVVCRHLGCGTAKAAPGKAYFGRGNGHIWLDELRCTGRETALHQCRANDYGLHNCNHGEDAGVECSDTPGDNATSIAGDKAASPTITGTHFLEHGPIRLVNGPSHCSGRVELFHNGTWGTICDDNWDIQDATVVCRQLGCGNASSAPGQAYFGRGSGKIWLDEVQCSGTESELSQCPARPLGQNNCNHGEDAGVVCAGALLIKLMNGTNNCRGRVEVFHNGEWGTICDDEWDINDAAVVCRYLGCGTAKAALGKAYFGRGNGHIWLDELRCTGRETALHQCQANYYGLHDCNHGEDAGIECSDTPGNTATSVAGDKAASVPMTGTHPLDHDPVRLVNGPGRCSGRVELFHNDMWGTICDRKWDIQDATVVCRQLGCGNASSAPGQAYFGRGSGMIWLNEVQCSGTESELSKCPARPLGQNNCNSEEDAGVVCAGDSLIKLMNGTNNCSGRVEVFHNGEWGTVCDDEWDISDAAVVCRHLGCGAAKAAPGSAYFGRGNGYIWLDELRCTGTEQALHQCQARPFGVHNCNHGEDAGVECSDTPGGTAISVAEDKAASPAVAEAHPLGTAEPECTSGEVVQAIEVPHVNQQESPVGGPGKQEPSHGDEGWNLSYKSAWFLAFWMLFAISVLAIGGIIWYFKPKGSNTNHFQLKAMRLKEDEI